MTDQGARWQGWAGGLLGLAVFAMAAVRVLAGEAGGLERVYCLVVLLCLAVAAAALSGRPGFGLFLAGVLGLILRYASDTKVALLHAPLLMPDLRHAFDPQTLSVFLHYEGIVRAGLGAGLGGAMVLALAWRWNGPDRWRRVASWPRRTLARAAASAAVVLLAGFTLGPHGPFARLHALQVWEFLLSTGPNPLTAFFLSTTRMQVQLPSYDPAAAALRDWSAPAPPPSARRPDLLAVLEESTFPPRLLALCDRPECDAALFAEDARTVGGGDLRVHTYGGATWVTEFAFLAGLPHTLFGPAGIYAPYDLAPRLRHSLVRTLKAQGYRTVAIYPMRRDFGNAQAAYAAYGFDALYDAVDLGLRWESPDTEYAQRVAEIWQRERAQAGEAPLFVFALTMRQHGPHRDPLESLPPPFNRPLFPQADAATNLALGNYLARLHQSDAAMPTFEHLVLDGPRPGVLLHFGDHQPAFDGLEMGLEKRVPPGLEGIAHSLTYYRIKASGTAAPLPRYALTDVSFLGGLLLQAAGLDPGPYFGANVRLREACAGRFLECPDAATLQSYYAEVFGRQGVLAR